MTQVEDITSLPDVALRVVRPIRAVVEELDADNFVAEVTGADVFASGDTADEAMDNLEDMVTATFQHFSLVPEERLGRIPSRQLKVLRQHIQRRAN